MEEAHARHCEAPFHQSLGPRPLRRIFHTLQGFIQFHSWIFEVLFPKCSSCLVSSQDVVFTTWIVVFLSRVLGCLHLPKSFRFLGLLWLLNPRCPAHFCAAIVQLFPVLSFNAFIYRLAKGVPISVYQRRTPPLLGNMMDIDTRLPSAHVIRFERQFLGAFPDRHLWVPLFSFRPPYLKGPEAFPQVSCFKGTTIVNLYKFLNPP